MSGLCWVPWSAPGGWSERSPSGTVLTAGNGGVAAPHATTAAAGTTSAAVVPDFGNPKGHFYVPPAGWVVNSSHPSHVIGNGRPSSCTSAAVVRAVAVGGVITFHCGPKPVTIVMSTTASVVKTRHLVVLDGGGLITLSGAAGAGSCTRTRAREPGQPTTASTSRIRRSSCRTSPSGTATATRIRRPARPTVRGCWYGGVTGGGAIYVEGGQFRAVNAQFVDNRCYAYGPDLGGGAIRALAQYDNRPVYITHDTFRGGRCSNGGALSSISVQWDILNSTFTDNRAIGWGANPAARGTPGGGSGGAVYLDGRDDNVLIAGTAMDDNRAREGGGAVFDVVDTGWGALTFKQFASAQRRQRSVPDLPRRLLPARRRLQTGGR